ncbi:radical SAM protein [Sediminibacterium sp.]|uniref:B12-binding domain-containing radical SAM protein n=1 Tax=Sediminibacterium sp. TaxID=1917865 RepID=UPI0025DB9DF0|nr:radical SAM protein [Sediminibacterium sp.]MBT9485468.1 radical SAM protein [Sediminibacterium sp.]
MSLNAIFVNGPFLKGFSRESRSPAVTKSGTLYYPGWLAYACGYAEMNGYTCSLLDSIADDISFQDSVKKVLDCNPQLVVIGTSTPSIDADINFARAIKEGNSSIIVSLVGTHASSMAKEIIREFDFIDFIARREYDETIKQILDAITTKKSWYNTLGITFKNDSREVVTNSDMPYIHDLDKLPFASAVYKKHLKIENYYYGHVRYPMVSIFTSRGCNARCNYCLYPQTMFGNFRSRSPKNIADEFKWIKENLPNVKEVLIDDDTFTMNKAHAMATAQELIKINNKLKWTCEARGNLDLETLQLMKKAGCRLIVTGFESVDQNVLDRVNKGIKMNVVSQYVKDAKKAGIKIHACFMAGNPGDSLETLNKTLDWAIDNNFDTIQFFPLQVYPGTKAYDWAVESGYIRNQDFRNWVSPTGMHSNTLNQNDVGLTYKEALDFCDYARRKYYLRPTYIATKIGEGLLDPVELRKNFIGFMNLKKYLFKNISKELS